MSLTKLLNKTKAPGSGTHAHYKGEFGTNPRVAKTDTQSSQSSRKEIDPTHRTGRAEHFANEARKAAVSHNSAKNTTERIIQAATVKHAADRAAVHANYVVKTHPGSELADNATLHAKTAEIIHNKIVAKVVNDSDDSKKKAEVALEKFRDAKELARAHAEDGDITNAQKHLQEAKNHQADVEKHSDDQVAHAKDDDSRANAEFDRDDRKLAMRMDMSSATNTVRMYKDAGEGYGDQSLIAGRDSVKTGESISAVSYTKDAIAFNNGLTRDQKFAVQNYSNHTDKILNSMLRDTKGNPDLNKDVYRDIAHDSGSAMKRDPQQTKDTSVRRELHDLDSAIASNKIDKDTKTYRTFSDPGGKIIGDLKVGGTFVDHGYVSTTGSKSVIDKFYHGEANDRIDMHITLKKGTSAAPIGHISTFGGEREMLLPRGSTFKVTNIVNNPGGGKQIHVEVSGE